MSDATVRFADSDQDVVAIHAFLCVVAGPLIPAPIDPQKSSTEVWRVVNHECALMAMRGDTLVGTLGIIKGDFWWGNQGVLYNRWFHALPGDGIGKLLLDAGDDFARDLGLELHIIDETKGRLVILNRNPLRKDVNPFLVPGPVEPTHSPHLTRQ